MTTVKELLDLLSNLPPDSRVEFALELQRKPWRIIAVIDRIDTVPQVTVRLVEK